MSFGGYIVEPIALSNVTKVKSVVVSFQKNLNTMMARAYSWVLIVAACFLGCGQSATVLRTFELG